MPNRSPHSPDMPSPEPSKETSWLDNLPAGKVTHYDTGEMLSRPDSGSNQVFVVNRGSARICLFGDSRELTLGCLNAGSIYVTHSRTWVEAMEPTDITSWPINQLAGMIAQMPEMAISALREVGIILHHATELIEDLAFRSVEARLARYLLLEQQNQNSPSIALTGHTELLASLLGTSRQTLSTLLNRLERDTVIERPDRRHLTILDAHRLQVLASMSAR